MGKLVETTFTTLDGVTSSPEKWSLPYWDEEYAAYGRELLFDADALLLGRETYEGFAEMWPGMEASQGEYAARMNNLPKHVASRTLKETKWNASLIEGDIAEEVAALKQSANLLKFGTGELDHTLLEHGLVDEYHFWICPVVAGSGTRLLEGLDATHLTFIKSTSFASGVNVVTYGPK